MRTSYHIRILVFLLIISINAYSQDDKSIRKFEIPKSPKEIILLDSATYLYEVGDFFISGQPNDSIYIALQNRDLNLIINLRTQEEIEIIKEEGFDEIAFLDSLNIPYYNIPMSAESGYDKETIQKINDIILLHKGNIMIHCRTAGRATYVWMAWLINYQELSVNKAITLGKQMRFRFYFEDLLGYELSLEKK